MEINQWEEPFIMTSQLGNDVARDIHCDITMSNDVAMYIYNGITMHNDVAMNLFCWVLLCLLVLFCMGNIEKTANVAFRDLSNTHCSCYIVFGSICLVISIGEIIGICLHQHHYKTPKDQSKLTSDFYF